MGLGVGLGAGLGDEAAAEIEQALSRPSVNRALAVGRVGDDDGPIDLERVFGACGILVGPGDAADDEAATDARAGESPARAAAAARARSPPRMRPKLPARRAPDIDVDERLRRVVRQGDLLLRLRTE